MWWLADNYYINKLSWLVLIYRDQPIITSFFTVIFILLLFYFSAVLCEFIFLCGSLRLNFYYSDENYVKLSCDENFVKYWFSSMSQESWICTRIWNFLNYNECSLALYQIRFKIRFYTPKCNLKFKSRTREVQQWKLCLRFPEW